MNNYEKVFESNNVYFIKLNKSLVNEYLEMVNSIEVQKYIRKEIINFSLEGEIEWINNKLENNSIVFSMIEKSTNEFIGNIELLQVENGVGELGIAITPNKQNMHYGTESINRFIDYALNDLKLSGLYLTVFDFNKRAIKCYENCGFVEIGKEDDEIRMDYIKK